MIRLLAAYFCGLLFGFGLGIAEMTSPQKVMGFLDLFGDWDPALMFVMVGAIAVYAAIYWTVVKKMKRPLIEAQFHIPTRKDLDSKLIIGSVLFGVGWGLGGYCPGPALVSLATLGQPTIIFVASMLVGMFGFSVLEKQKG
jgi:uncharacterized membrane protein YedE/YeeE